MTATNYRETFDGYNTSPLPSPWVHVQASGYNRWAAQDDGTFPGGYAYINGVGTTGLPAVALLQQYEVAAYVMGDFYSGLPHRTGIIARATTSGSPTITDWQGFYLVREDNTATTSDYVLTKRESGGVETELGRWTVTHGAGAAPGRLGILYRGTTLQCYANDRLLGQVTSTHNQTATLGGLYGESEGDQKCDTFEGAYVDQSFDWLDSFAHVPAGEPTQKYVFGSIAGAGGVTYDWCEIVTNGAGGSQRALRIQGTASGGGGVAFAPIRVLVDSRDTGDRCVTGSWYYFRSYPTENATPISTNLRENNDPFTLCMNANGKLQVFEGTRYGDDPLTGRLARSVESGAPVPLNTSVWIGYEARWEQGTTMHYRVMVGRATWLQGSYATDPDRFSYIRESNACVLGTYPGPGQETDVDYDCWEWYYRVGDYPWVVLVPEGRVEVLRPDGAGASTQWTPSAGANYECVDDDLLNEGTDYVSSGTAGQTDTYPLSNLAGSSQVYVATVNVAGAAAGSGALDMQAVMRISGTDQVVAFWSTLSTGSYACYRVAYAAVPYGGAPWSPSAINALELGPKINSVAGVGRSERVSQVVLEVLTGDPMTARRRNVAARVV